MKKFTILFTLLFILNSNYTIAQVKDSLKVLMPVSHKYAIERLAWSNNGRHFATGSNDGYIKLWDAKSASITHTLGESRSDGVGVGSLCFTPDGKYLLSGLIDIDIWDVASGLHVGRLDTSNLTYIYSIDISSDSKTALNASGSAANLWDIKSGKQIREYKHPGFVQCVKFTKDATKFITGCQDGTVRLYDTSSEAVIKEFKLTNKEIVAVDFSFDENKIVLADENKVYVCDTNTRNLIKSFESRIRRDRGVAFTPDDNSLLVSEYNNVRQIDLRTGKSTVVFTYDTYNEVAYSKDRKRALCSIEGTESLYGTTDTRIVNLENGETVREFKNRFSPIKEVKFAPDNRTLATIVGLHQIRLIDLSNITSYKFIKSRYIKAPSFSPNGKMLAYGHGGPLSENFISVVDPVSLNIIRTLKMVNGVTSISFSGDNKLMAVGLTSGQVQIIDLAKGTSVYSFNALTDYVTRLNFSIQNDFLLVATSSTIEVRNIAQKKREWYYPHDKPLDEQKFPKVSLKRWSPETRMLLDLYKNCPFPQYLSDVRISPDGKNVFSFRDQTYFVKKDAKTNASIKYEGHQGEILSISVSDNNKLIASSANDNTLRIWDSAKGKMLVSYFAVDSSDWFWITPDNYYYSSRNASRVVSFKKSNQIYRFHQFDLQLNRPDLVMKNIGLSSDSLITFYNQLIQKRFRRMGIQSGTVSSGFNAPVLDISNLDSIPDITLEPTISLSLKATSPNEVLSKINIWVNGVPVYRVSLEEKDIFLGKPFQKRFKVPLVDGENVIEVSCSDKSQRESLIESVFVKYNPQVKQKPNLYIVAIGVSEYNKYPDAKLKYADKDATNLVKEYSASKLFNKVYADTLTNSLANRNNILKIKDKLMKATVNDLVILSYSGHGIVDNNLDFYFCTNDLDLDRTGATAISFKEMENLLDGIPSYKKMLLIDACYSGEVDIEEARAMVTKNDSTKALHIGNAKPIVPGNALKLGKQRALELMQDSFIDLRRRTGTAVISSSSGVEVSYEKDEWKNGLFTYAMLNALRNTKEVDLNGDGIYVSELIPYLVRSVKELSLGLQVPTIREENIEYDFRIW